MNDIIDKFQNIKTLINNSNVNIIAVSKTFSFEKIKPLLDFGHIHFGENKVQEAKLKWSNTSYLYPSLKLHMIGKLQSNKAKDAVELFDFIHSIDNEKLASLIVKYENLLKKKIKCFIQVNIGSEEQKSGVQISQVHNFYNYCKKISLNVVGLMCIPPNDKNSKKYFTELAKLSNSLKLNQISMGMSSDFMDAIQCGSTFVRIGSAIFGDRTSK